MQTLRTIVDGYFKEYPDCKDEVLKAFHAYHAGHFRLHPESHNFTNGSRESYCRWCGRTREMVRWDNLPATCQKRPLLLDIEETILVEELKLQDLMVKARFEVPKLVRKYGRNADALAMFKDTYGYDSETVEMIMQAQ